MITDEMVVIALTAREKSYRPDYEGPWPLQMGASNDLLDEDFEMMRAALSAVAPMIYQNALENLATLILRKAE